MQHEKILTCSNIICHPDCPSGFVRLVCLEYVGKVGSINRKCNERQSHTTLQVDVPLNRLVLLDKFVKFEGKCVRQED